MCGFWEIGEIGEIKNFFFVWKSGNTISFALWLVSCPHENDHLEGITHFKRQTQVMNRDTDLQPKIVGRIIRARFTIAKKNAKHLVWQYEPFL